MVNFEITNSQLNRAYVMSDDNVIVAGTFILDYDTGAELTNGGQVYAKNADGSQGNYIGAFTGTMHEDGMHYSLTEMTYNQTKLVWKAIGEIEEEINSNS